jgi:zinc protease
MKQINKVVLGAMLFPLAVFAQQMDYSKAILLIQL